MIPHILLKDGTKLHIAKRPYEIKTPLIVRNFFIVHISLITALLNIFNKYMCSNAPFFLKLYNIHFYWFSIHSLFWFFLQITYLSFDYEIFSIEVLSNLFSLCCSCCKTKFGCRDTSISQQRHWNMFVNTQVSSL